MEPEELIRQYDPRAAVPDHEVWKAHWSLNSERVRTKLKGFLRVPYGDTAGQTMDIFPAREPNAPAQVFIHGGFWRSLDSFDHTLIVPMFRDAGATTILLNYDLCPAVPLSELIRQVRVALAAIWHQAEAIDIDRDRIFVSGHSAGGHLAAMLAATDCESLSLPEDTVKGATLVSGLYDLTPILQLPGSEDLQIAEETVPEVSPAWNLPPAGFPVLLAVGGRETAGFIQQAHDFAASCRQSNRSVTLMEPEYDNHYSILHSFSNPVTELGKAVLAQMGLAA